MKRVIMNEYGGPEVLHLTDAPIPQPGPGEVLLKNGQIIFCSRRRRRETREAFLVYAGAGKFSHETI